MKNNFTHVYITKYMKIDTGFFQPLNTVIHKFNRDEGCQDVQHTFYQLVMDNEKYAYETKSPYFVKENKLYDFLPGEYEIRTNKYEKYHIHIIHVVSNEESEVEIIEYY